MRNTYRAISHLIPHKMKINSNMLDFLVKLGISTNIGCTSIITIDYWGCCRTKNKFTKQRHYPTQFRSSTGNIMIFRFSWEPWNRTLLPRSLWNGIVAKEYHISYCGCAVFFITSLICIKKMHEELMGSDEKERGQEIRCHADIEGDVW